VDRCAAHLWSERYLDLLARLGNTRTAVHRGLEPGATDDELRKRFELMDGAGIQMQILSVTPASPHFESEADAVEARARQTTNTRANTALPGPLSSLCGFASAAHRGGNFGAGARLR